MKRLVEAVHGRRIPRVGCRLQQWHHHTAGVIGGATRSAVAR